MTDYQRIGGDDSLRGHINAFVDRMFADWVIGFVFDGKDRDRIVHLEAQHAAAVLGGPKRYEGRSLAVAHRPLRINRGQFRRRLALLQTVLRERGVDPAIIERWVAIDSQLEAVITDGSDCLLPDVSATSGNLG